jgi:hypothetical protein
VTKVLTYAAWAFLLLLGVYIGLVLAMMITMLLAEYDLLNVTGILVLLMLTALSLTRVIRHPLKEATDE